MMKNTNMQEIMQMHYTCFMQEYVAGTLDEAHSLIFSSHIALSPAAAQLSSTYETLAGTLVERTCEPVPMKDSSLKSVLARLDEEDNFASDGFIQESDHKAEKALLPLPVRKVTGCDVEDLSWSSLFPGMSKHSLDLSCPDSSARLLKAEPGVKSPHHAHGGLEVTLVLDGAFSDETGDYKRGDLVITTEDIDHTPLACPDKGCLCLVVTSAPIKLKGWKSVFNPFLKR